MFPNRIQECSPGAFGGRCTILVRHADRKQQAELFRPGRFVWESFGFYKSQDKAIRKSTGRVAAATLSRGNGWTERKGEREREKPGVARNGGGGGW